MTEDTYTCEYCDKEFVGSRAHITHLDKQHYEELGRVDKQKVKQKLRKERTVKDMLSENAGGIWTAILVVIGIVTAYLTVVAV